MTPISQDQHPDEPRPPGETERDNDALRPTDPKQRENTGKGTPSGESTAQDTAQDTAKQQTSPAQTKAKP